MGHASDIACIRGRDADERIISHRPFHLHAKVNAGCIYLTAIVSSIYSVDCLHARLSTLAKLGKEGYMIRFCIFVLLLTSISAAYTQGEKKPRTEADYRWRTLKELTTLQPDYIAKDAQSLDPNLSMVVHADLFPSRVKVLYDGTRRPLLENRKALITLWAKQFAGAPEFYTVPYQTEMLFTEEGKSYWLAVRRDSLPRFKQELRKGETVELFLIKLGNIQIDNKLEPVLLVEKFAKQ